MTDDHGIHFEQRGRAGVITLDRPEALNAVTDGMVRAIDARLDDWERDDSVRRIVIHASPGRAFSAGGDIRHLYESGMAGDPDFGFFAREYALNARIHHFPKPYIALIDGIAMGGGVGVSFHGSHRIVGEKAAFAMPEVGIGFFPDIGGSYLLSRLPGKLGLYLALTGERLKQADCVASGLATHGCTSDQMPTLLNDLCQAETLVDVLDGLPQSYEPSDAAQWSWINDAFKAQSVEHIIEALDHAAASEHEAHANWAAKTIETLGTKSPTSLKLAFEQLRRATHLPMVDCMRMEYRILRRVLPQREFYEGIRAAIIDKDGAPQWQPASLSDVSAEMVVRYFLPLGEEELNLP
ncbi:MAG: enoyl-CoA hydratase/isomerase family protein [Ahrensia sp.]|nr:enoyl-CoA hydratase/isomerase family protein [Ahrensia sp.]